VSDDPTITRTFAQFLAQVEDGRLHGDLSDGIRELIEKLHDAAVNAGGIARGKLSVSFDFLIKGGVVEVTADYAVKAPKLARGRSIFWATPENNLTRRNPAQPDLPFRDVNVPAARNIA
jgi:hypothetical protein